MKAISLWQPWASLWCSPAKVHETRHWPTPHRGWLLVHAAKRHVDDDSALNLDAIMDEHFGHHWGLDIPFGAIVGAVHLIDCTPTEKMPAGHHETDDYECGDFSPGRFAWRRNHYRLFAQPIPYRGAQGFFNVPTELVADQFGLATKESAEDAVTLPVRGPSSAGATTPPLPIRGREGR